MKTVIHAGPDWQIVSTLEHGLALLVQEPLGRHWIDCGLIAEGRLRLFGFGHQRFFAASFAPDNRVAPVHTCRPPTRKAEALGFAISLKATRDLDPDSPLQDALYIEPWSRLLPTYSDQAPTEDPLLLGQWLTGGLTIPATAVDQLLLPLGWMLPQDIRDVVSAAGLAVSATGPDRGQTASVARRTNPFSLPGRPALEAFLREHVLDIIDHRDRYTALGVGFPSAIVLHGPPGGGKTFAVERLIDHLGWPGFQIDAQSVASPYLHETSRKIAAVFGDAAQNAPSVLVIDEMEAFLMERESGTGHHRVEEVAEFLRQIPKAAAHNVLIVAMTNRLDMIDPAILRRGRFDHVIEVGLASEQDVAALLSSLLSPLPHAGDVDPAALARKLAGRPLSDVAFIVREAARLAARDERDAIGQTDLLAAVRATPSRGNTERRIGFL